ncbi:MAG: SusC/RagA family TonB-linked outer membrane protein [Mariniphaga sp.]|jgi:TonB-linked SusC/RagA family outer membrane protein|nr:SusC/RagA family TonB-linked outer membrane protein [Mariniphaga sp.]
MKQKLRIKGNILIFNIPKSLIFILLGFLFLLPAFAFSGTNNGSVRQDSRIQVSGEVRDNTGELLPGVNVFEKGTMNGTVTNVDGIFTINVPSDATLVLSFVGFQTLEIPVNGQTTLNVVMEEETVGLEEVVVTAMGIRSEKRKLNFAVQSVDSEELNEGKQTNFVDALQGKIAGIEVSGTGGSPSASSQILIRGISSINPAQNNEPIFILNGMHISGGASKAAEINPNDIENITVLKGAAAAALYGQEASNGAIIITTKSGQVGEIRVEASGSVQVDQAYRVPEIQQMYLRGSLGVYREQSMGGWGPLAPEGTVIFDNPGNFLKTGLYQKYDVSVSGGSERFSSYTSGNYVRHDGIVPSDYLERYGVLFKSKYNVSDKVSVDFMANLVSRNSRGGAGISSAYHWPIDDDITNYKNPDGTIRWLYIDTNNRYNSPISPLWSRYEDSAKYNSNRSLMQGSVTWTIIENLDLTGRISYDLTESESKSIVTPRWSLEPGQTPTSEDLNYLGSFFYSDGKSSVVNGGILATYSKDISNDFGMELLAGVDVKSSYGRSAGLGGRQFIVPEFYSVNNLADIRRENITMNRSEKNMYGYYGEVKLDYKGIAQFSATGRNDHSSTLPVENRSYFYPSFSTGIIFTELLKLPENIISFGKIRANWARVGKDAPLYRLNNWYKAMPHPDNGYGVDPTRSSNPHLEPEMTTSWEIGADARLFGDKTRLDIAWFATAVSNQIVDVRVSPASGNILQTRNEGDIKNEGIEISWDQTMIDIRNFRWNMITNFGRSRGTVEDLPDQLVEVYHYAGQVSDIRPTAYLGGSTMALSGKDYLRTDDGRIILDEQGQPKINASSSLLIGNREPDFTIGWLNRWNYKAWSLSVMMNFRKGGDVVNGTLRSLMSGGQAKILEDYRNRQILIDGVIEMPDGTYAENTVPVVFDQTFYMNYYAPVGSNFVEDASLMRIGYATLAYNAGNLAEKIGIKGLSFSLTGRNLLLLTNYSGSDPVVNYTGSSGGTGTFGIDYLGIPNTRSYTFNVSATF